MLTDVVVARSSSDDIVKCYVSLLPGFVDATCVYTHYSR